MAKKKANGEGSVFKSGSGYQCQFTEGRDPSTGKLIRKTFYGKTKLEALKKKEDYIIAKRTGTYVEPMKMYVSDWLTSWLNTFKKPMLSAKTFDRYESIINVHLIPSIGCIKLQDLKSEHVQDMYNDKYKNGKGNLSEGSIRYLHIVLKQALDKAVQLDYIVKNPEKNCTIPKVTQKEVEILKNDEINSVIANLDTNNAYDMAILVDMFTGLRKGELTSLTWSDIDFDEGYISINKSISRVIDRDTEDSKELSGDMDKNKNTYKNIIKMPKTQSSKRQVPLPESLIPLLNDFHSKMIEEYKASDKKLKEYDLVFQSKSGKPLSSPSLSKHWKMILTKSNVNYIKFHALRHTYASLLNSKNENPKVIQLLLGHSNLSTTMNIYVHSSEEQKKNAAAKINYLIDIKNNDSNGKIKERCDVKYKLYRTSKKNMPVAVRLQ
jgi:integrase